MLVSNTDKNQFHNEFKKRFENFIISTPLHLSYSMGGDGVSIGIHFANSSLAKYDFEFDYFESVKSNIAKIKDYLMKEYYPVVDKEIVTEEFLPQDEVDDLVLSGVPVVEAVKKTVKKTVTISFYIEKIMIEKNSAFLKAKSSTQEEQRVMLEFKKPVLSELGLLEFPLFRPVYRYSELESKVRVYSVIKRLTKE